MIKKKGTYYTKPEIDLSGPDGNALVLIGYASRLIRQLHLDLDVDTVVKEISSSEDYEQVIATFDKYFGEYVDLVR